MNDRPRYFEDYTDGLSVTLGSVIVTEADMLDFARRYDPQPFHLDPVAAAAGPFGGLIASGWHTCALVMRLLAEHYLSPVAGLPSPGVDELRWPAPLRAGDTLTVHTTVRSARVSQSKPDRGIVTTLVEGTNQQGATVLRLSAINLVLRNSR